jgi:hypothetical protein
MAAKVSTTPDIAPPRETGARVHRVILDIVPPIPAEVPVATAVSFKVRASCADLDLRGGNVEIVASEHVVATPALVEHRDGCNETAAIAIRSPVEVGDYGLTVVFPRQEIGGEIFEESLLPIALRTRPHRTSLAVWAVPSPVRTGSRFSVTVGVKSAGGCELKGAGVEVSDDTGAVVGHGTLGDTPWQGTSGLYWAEIEVTAPPREGTYCWGAAFPTEGLEPAHDDSEASFGFAAVGPPAHKMTVKVTESEGAAPIADVQVALGPYRAATDVAGVANLEIPAGHFDLAIWKSGFEYAPTNLEIAGDLSLQVEMKRLPQEPTVWD